jgi:nitroreductase
MEFFEVTRERHSVRKFEARAVEQDKLQTILESVNSAPSAGNLQAYEVYLLTEPQRRQAVAKAALDQGFIAAAPVVLVFCAHPARSASYGVRGQRLYAPQDATIACTYAMLAATALGLASVWVGAFRDEGVRRAAGAPEGQIPVAVLPIGYAAETPQPTGRRPLADLVHRV